MKTSKVFLGLANDILMKAQRERSQVVKEGRSEAWNLEQYANIEAKYRAEANALANQMLTAARAEVDELKNRARLIRNKPSSPLKPVHGDLLLYHQNRMKYALEGLTPEEAIKEYEFAVSILTPQEMPYLHVYEDVLMSKMKEPAHKLAAEGVTWKYKAAEEKTAITKAKQAEEKYTQLETLAEIIKHDTERVASGKYNPPDYDYGRVLDEMGTYESPDVAEVKINPYDSETE